MRRKDQAASQQKAEDQWAKEQTENYARKRSEYDRAYSACLEGKGYTVK